LSIHFFTLRKRIIMVCPHSEKVNTLLHTQDKDYHGLPDHDNPAHTLRYSDRNGLYGLLRCGGVLAQCPALVNLNLNFQSGRKWRDRVTGRLTGVLGQSPSPGSAQCWLISISAAKTMRAARAEGAGILKSSVNRASLRRQRQRR
jgi:hypothetical protein